MQESIRPVALDADDHFWGTVSRTHESMAKDSPAGFVTRVEVQLVTGEIIEPAVVQSISPWLFFEMGDEIQTRRVVVVRPEHIAKVEIKFIRADGKQPPGFQVKTPQDAI